MSVQEGGAVGWNVVGRELTLLTGYGTELVTFSVSREAFGVLDEPEASEGDCVPTETVASETIVDEAAGVVEKSGNVKNVSVGTEIGVLSADEIVRIEDAVVVAITVAEPVLLMLLDEDGSAPATGGKL
jgi:hypothetical protein